MAEVYKKRALLTGLGDIYLQFMTSTDGQSTAPTYEQDTFVAPSLDKAEVELEVANKKVFLSNKIHTNIESVKSAKITLDTAYLPEGFTEKAQGAVELEPGVYAMPTNPVKKVFRMAVPFTDENGDEFIINFPSCTLSPVSISGETEREDIDAQLKSVEILAIPLEHKGDLEKNVVYHTADLAKSETKQKFDRNKLLANGWFDKTSLAKCVK